MSPSPIALFRCPVVRLACAAAILVIPRALGYQLIGGSWPTGNITMTLQLDATKPASPALPLLDGSTSWNAVAQAAMADWNGILGRSKLASVTSTSTTAQTGDRINNVFFSSTVYGQAFDSLTLAVTVVDNFDSEGISTVRINEADLVVNSNRTWNSYRGSVRSNPVDLRRVLLHELGHVLGLDHPDQAVPPQTAPAIMMSAISNLEAIQTDDANGVSALYNTTLFVPTSVAVQPTTATLDVAGSTTLALTVNGSTSFPDPNPLLGYYWYFKAAGASSFERLFTVLTPNLDFGTAQLTDAGSYYVVVMTPDRTIQSNTVTLNLNPITTNSATSLADISSRGIAGSGDSSMIVGFAISGSQPKTVLLRAVGPTLTQFGMSPNEILSDPQLKLYAQSNTSTAIATSPTQWDQDTATAAAIRDTSSRIGAFSLVAGSKDAVILTTLNPGLYSAVTSSPSGNTGIVLLEAYDADATLGTGSRLGNLSTRGHVGTGNDVLIAGFVVQGPGPHTYLIRVSGPSLAGSPFNVSNTIPDPILSLYRQGNNTSTLIRVNDDWDSPASAQASLYAASQQVGAFAYAYPSTVNNQRDGTAVQPVMLVTLPPGNYSAMATGNANNNTTATTGNALIEIYEVQ